MADAITIYTDGSSRGNPGPGGYGAILMSGTHRKEISQGFLKTTNNRMELLGVIAALESIKNAGGDVTLQKFDVSGMKEVARNSYAGLPDRVVFQDLIKLKKRVCYIFEALDKKAGVFTVYAREINAADATLLKQITLFTSGGLVANPPYSGDLTKAVVAMGFGQTGLSSGYCCFTT